MPAALFKYLKQAIDRAAINAASKSLPPGVARTEAEIAQARDLLRSEGLLRPSGVTAQLTRAPDGTFQFHSPVTTGIAKNDQVHGKLFLAGESWATKPLVIVVHGWNAELHYLHVLPFVARALNKHRLNAALIELPFHLHRRPLNGTMRDFISDDLPGMLRATHQAISDIDSLARWAKAQGCQNVAVWGFSLGAWLAGLYICQSTVPSAAVLTTPIANLASAVRELQFCHPIRSAIEGTDLDLTPLNLTHYRPLIPPDAIQVMQSDYDLFAPVEEYAELARAWDLKQWEKEPHGHISILTSRRAMKRSIQWLESRLA